ncbi:MAG: radical SAM family heme chaperone HemW [Desulfobulbaceae bacterium]
MPCADLTSPGRERTGLYLHVPFCLRKCPYCGFFSQADEPALHRGFLEAVARQAAWFRKSGLAEGCRVDTVFVGGGTPSLLPPPLLTELLDLLRDAFPLSGREIEFSVEVNPATLRPETMEALRRGGCNRLSIGVQSFADEELRAIGRPHTAADGVRAVRAARTAGFTNCSLDLMYGLPGQTVKSWEQTLATALGLALNHLAIYELTIEEGTPFSEAREQGKLALPSEEEVVAMMETTERMTVAAGFVRYEISNYARPGRECRHNCNYWHNGWYVGLGPGAVSCLDGWRVGAVPDVREFQRRLVAGRDWWSWEERLEGVERFRETVVMGLRMSEGISLSGLGKRFGLDLREYYGPTLERLVSRGMVEISGDRLRLTSAGMRLANPVMAELV